MADLRIDLASPASLSSGQVGRRAAHHRRRYSRPVGRGWKVISDDRAGGTAPSGEAGIRATVSRQGREEP